MTNLIKYFANDGDLLPPEDLSSSGSSYSSPRHQSGPELVSVEPQEIVNLSESQHQQMHEIIKDALEEDEVVKSPTPRCKFFKQVLALAIIP